MAHIIYLTLTCQSSQWRKYFAARSDTILFKILLNQKFVMLICQMYLSRELLMQCIETQNAHFRDSELKSIKVWNLSCN